MHTLRGYEVRERLYAQGNKSVLRVRRESDGLLGVLRYFEIDAASHSEVERIKSEFECLKALHSPQVIPVYDLVFFEHGVGVLTGDFDGTSLADILARSGPLPPRLFLDIAIELSKGLLSIHQAHVIHRDLKPGNVLVNESTGELRIVDFGISDAFLNNQAFEQIGTLPYMSPEQTGKMNRPVDLRSDLYSLGIVFYELLTGRCPFPSNDPLELVHSHIARLPTPPSTLDRSIPAPISEIVEKLLQKEADNRYQTATGVLADLTLCRAYLERGQEVPADLAIGARDQAQTFRIPQRLYGRHEELEKLLTTFSSAAAGRFELVLVSGYSGIGKSALIREVQKPLVAARGFFVSGKYDQFNKAKPYSAIQQALDGLVRIALRKSEVDTEGLRKHLLEALAGEGQALVDVVPLLERFVGPQPPLRDMGPVARQNRFKRACEALLRAFSSPEHPLVLFLDDLQWADAASLDLLRDWIEREIPHAMLILAYRDNEVGANHPLNLVLQHVLRSELDVVRIKLTPLREMHVEALVADTLKRDAADILPLARILFEKTGGNPFFLTQMFTELYREGLVTFSPTGWVCDLHSIQALGLSGNVVDLMTEKLSRYPEWTRSALNMSAILGADFALNTFACVLDQSKEDTYRLILPAIRDGLLLEQGGNIRFAHDRIHEAAYALEPQEEREKRHHRAARHLLNTLDPDGVERMLFKITEDLNRSRSLIGSERERYELFALNVRAGHKALAASAFAPSAEFFSEAIALLPASSWSQTPILATEAHFGLASARYAQSEYEECKRIISLCLEHADDPVDAAPAVELLVKALFGLNRYTDALRVALGRLRSLGIDLPERPSKARVLAAYAELKRLQGSRSTASLINLQTATDRRAIAALNILNAAAPTSFVVNGELMALMGLTMGQLSIRYGNSTQSPFGYSVCMIVEGGMFKAIRSGSEYLDLALAVHDKYPSAQQRAQLELMRACFWLHQTRDVSDWERLAMSSVALNVDAGIPYFADYTLALTRCMTVFFGTRSLDDAYRTNEDLLAIHKKHGDQEVIQNQLFVLKLLNRFRDAESLGEEIDDAIKGFDTECYAERLKGRDNVVTQGIWALFRQAELYLDGEYDASLRVGLSFAVEALGLCGLMVDHLHRFFFNLAYLASESDHRSLTLSERAKASGYYHLNRALFTTYARHAPNYDSHVALMDAEEYRRRADFFAAARAYERAANCARGKTSFNEALAFRRLSRMYASQGMPIQAELSARAALACYRHLGFRSEVRRLEHEFPVLSLARQPGLGALTGANAGGSASTFVEKLDVESLSRGARAISSEVRFEGLIEALLRQLCQSSAAQRAVLLLRRDHQVNIEGEMVLAADGDVLRVLQGEPFPVARGGTPVVAESLVQFVLRVQRAEVQGDIQLSDFGNDPYVQKRMLKSVLCMPILNQGKVLGALYLENALVAHAFSPQQQKALEILASQAAVAFENAHLVLELEEKVLERTTELRQKTNDLNSMLQNLDQGVFTILPGGTIHDEYSKQLESILGVCGIAGRDYLEVLFGSATLSADVVSQVSAAVKISLGAPLLWYECNRHLLVGEMEHLLPDGRSRLLQLSWNPILRDDDVVDKILVSVKDVTELRTLEKRAQEQRRDLEIIGQILAIPRAAFVSFVRDSKALISVSEQLLNEGPVDNDELAALFRNMHTIKGNARTLGFQELARLAHRAEDTYATFRSDGFLNIERARRDLLDVSECLERHRQVYKESLLPLDDDGIVIEAELLARLRDAAERRSQELPNLVDAIGTLALEDVVASVVKGLKTSPICKDRPMPHVRVSAEGIRLKPEVASTLRDAFTHLLHNALEHGIEPAFERTQQGKPEVGEIVIDARVRGQEVEILVRDDGRGLSIDALRALASERALTLESDEQVAELVFISGLSTAKVVNDTSGRGVGMDAIRTFITNLGGRVELRLEGTKAFRPFITQIVLPARHVVQLLRPREPLSQDASQLERPAN